MKFFFLMIAAIIALSNSMAIHAREIEFSGYKWDVKEGGIMGPGDNYWSSDDKTVWVDQADGTLHMKIRKINGKWHCSEVTLQKDLGYGTYRFYVDGRIDTLDKNVIFSVFLYQDDNNEIDIEFSKWGKSSADNSQFVIQPSTVKKYNMKLSGTYSTHSILWQPDKVTFSSLHGHYETAPGKSHIIKEWTYTKKADIPKKPGEKAHINLWLLKGTQPSSEIEIIISKFEFQPY